MWLSVCLCPETLMHWTQPRKYSILLKLSLSQTRWNGRYVLCDRIRDDSQVWDQWRMSSACVCQLLCLKARGQSRKVPNMSSLVGGKRPLRPHIYHCKHLFSSVQCSAGSLTSAMFKLRPAG